MLKGLVPFTRRVATFVMNSPFRRVARWFGFKQRVTEEAYIDLVNTSNEKAFSETPFEERMLALPHCLRHKDCPAELGDYGYGCKNCGRCSIANLKAEAEKLGYNVFVVPGGSVVARIIKKFRPKGALGVACSKELLQALEMTENENMPTQTVTLLKDGCINTIVDEESVIEKIRMGDV